MNECRNCGKSELQDIGPVGRVEPFFLKRVFGMEIFPARSKSPLKQLARDLASMAVALLRRLHTMHAFVELQVCRNCSFIQTKIPFRDDDIMNLYVDYREPSYNSERIKFEPGYSAIAAAVGHDEVEIRNRTTALNAFLRKALPAQAVSTILDFGGSDGQFMPDIEGEKFIYELSNLELLPGITRINSESELGKYSLVLLAHVTEHVPHPLNLVRKVRSHVEPGGYLYIETPYDISDEERNALLGGGRGLQIGIHEHINSYCPPAVSALLESAGFEVVAIECTPVDVGWGKAHHIRALGRIPV